MNARRFIAGAIPGCAVVLAVLIGATPRITLADNDPGGSPGSARGSAPGSAPGSARVSRSIPSRNVAVRHRPADVQRRTFDPANPPREMPRLSPSEAAITTADFRLSTQIGYTILHRGRDGGEHTFEARINQLTLEPSLSIVVWLPTRARRPLRDHEEAHRKLFEYWHNDAESVVREIAEPYVGKTVRGRGPTPKAAEDNATNEVLEPITRQYMARIHDPAAKANAEFDRITQHGRNDIPIPDAVRRSIDAAQ